MILENPITDLIGNVIADVKEDMLSTLQAAHRDIQDINYQYGSMSEIKAVLEQWDQDSKYKHLRYPAIILILPVTVRRGLQSGWSGRFTCSIGILYHTQPDLTSAERIDQSFKNILRPLYENFVQNLLDSGYFAAYDVEDIPHQYIEHTTLGKDSFIKLDEVTYDYIDAIEMGNLELTAVNKYCSTT